MPKLTLAELRRKHPRFIFQALHHQLKGTTLEVEYHFTLEPGIEFKPRLTFQNIDVQRYQSLDATLIQRWLFYVGMVEVLSYWKAACSPEIVVRAGYLSSAELSFWKKLLQKGMSEFFFVNQVDGWQDTFVQFVVEAQPESYELDHQPKKEQLLIPMGGGKDSVVTLETLKKLNLPITLMSLNTLPATQRVRTVSQVMSQLTVSRFIDPQLLMLNKEGYLNGHTPFSALLAFISSFSAYLADFQYVVLSNEWSANEGNIVFQGQVINHQYSKSLEFESDFREYSSAHLSSAINYFSFLRPLHELQIAQLFSHYPQYFPSFLSCNRGSREGKWCGICPKCVFAAVILSPFLSLAQITQIFGYAILDNAKLIPILEELTGMVEIKSLECVGTRDETRAALFLATQRFEAQQFPALLQYAKEHIVSENSDSAAKANEILRAYQTPNFLPPQFDQLLKQEMGAISVN